jgi:hypothetical protein
MYPVKDIRQISSPPTEKNRALVSIKKAAGTPNNSPAHLHERGGHFRFRTTYAKQAAQKKISDPAAHIVAAINPRRGRISCGLYGVKRNQR